MTTNGHREQVDRLARGELTAPEARKLAQASLDDPELFDELTRCAVAKAAMEIPAARVVPFRQRRFAIAMSSAAAAVAIGFAIYFLRAPQPAAHARISAALAQSAQPGQALLLAKNLEPGTSQFRAGEPDSRAPRDQGSVESVENGVAAIDLGSLDGLAAGTKVDVAGGGRVEITAVFRERSRGRTIEGRIKKGDRIEVPASDFFSALWQQVDSLSARGDRAAAHSAAEKAIEWAGQHQVTPPPEALNTIGVFRLLDGDAQGAQAPLKSALANAGANYGSVTNNLGVAAELAGDRARAVSYYSDAVRFFSSAGAEADRRAAETNLARLKAAR